MGVQSLCLDPSRWAVPGPQAASLPGSSPSLCGLAQGGKTGLLLTGFHPILLGRQEELNGPGA